MNRADTVGASRDTVLMLDFLFSPISTHPDAPRFYHLAQIGMNRGDSWPESCLCNLGLRRSNFKLFSGIGHMMQRVLGNILCDLDPKVKGQIMNFLVIASLKPFDVVTSNSVGA